MKIQLSENRRIFGGKYDWAVQSPVTRKGKREWRSLRYYSSFAGAVESCVHEEIRLHPATTLAEAIEAVDTLIHRYNQLIPEEYRALACRSCCSEPSQVVE